MITKIEPIEGTKIRQKITATCDSCGKEKEFHAATGDYVIGDKNGLCNDCLSMGEDYRYYKEQYEKFVGKKIKSIEVHDGHVSISFSSIDDIIEFALPGYE